MNGIFIIAELDGPVAERVKAWQEQFDIKLAREAPPHVTMLGSSGVGPIAPDTPVDALQRLLGGSTSVLVGQSGTGKSSLLNALLGEERAIVSPVPGTTRDTIDTRVAWGRGEIVLIDTAGIRRKGKTREMAEKLSVVMARRHIRMAHVVLLVVDVGGGSSSGNTAIAASIFSRNRC